MNKSPVRILLVIFILCLSIAGHALAPAQKLSPFWSQEYTGADLARRILEKENLALPATFVTCFDVAITDHGQLAMNLIVSPKETALFASGEINFVDLNMSPGGYSGAFRAFANACGVACPRIITNSTQWGSNSDTSEAIGKLRKQGTLFVTSADNGSAAVPVLELKTRLSKDLDVIIVGSVTPTGGPSFFSQPSSEVTVSAPANHEQLSYSNGAYKRFGGTSGATPMVSAALAAFEVTTGLRLSGKEAKELLRRTSLRSFHSYQTPTEHGAGILNTFKIVRVGLKLRDQCQGSADVEPCLRALLTSEASYDFKVQRSPQFLFENCEDLKGRLSLMTPEQIHEYLSFWRERALLEKQDSGALEAVACVYEAKGLSLNAKFYRGLALASTPQSLARVFDEVSGDVVAQDPYLLGLPQARRLGVDPMKLLKHIDLNKEMFVFVMATLWQDRPDLLEAMVLLKIFDKQLAHSYFPLSFWKRDDLLAQLIDRGGVDNDIALRVLSRPQWTDRPDFLAKIIAAGRANNNVVLALSNEWWIGHPELVEMLLAKSDPRLDNYLGPVLLSQRHWKKYYQDLLGSLTVSPQAIRDFLEL
ncbi:MAG TPA: S8 family serine peptidase [Bacteriovoracaceae bacterium]|nr:S8 family serine peptidase [Bacteriovoracaceae bacterium]